jgi:DNA polymerase-3 subunit delta
MALIIFGAQPLMIKKQVKKFLLETFSNADKYNVIYLNSHEISEGNIIDECEQMSLTSSNKVVIVENSNFLTAEHAKDKMEYSSELLSYLKHENENTKLIFTVVYDKQLDNRNTIVKYVKENGKILECKDLKADDWKLYTTKYFERRNVKISDDAINEICKRCNGDLNVFINEVDKLLLYKMNDITLKDVELLITKPLEDNIFDILDKLLHGKKNDAIEIYRDLLLQKVEPVVLISIISTTLTYLDRVLYLNSLRQSYTQIASETKSNPYRVMVTLKDFRNVDKGLISSALDSLYELDKTIKHNNIDRFYGFELFLLNF